MALSALMRLHAPSKAAHVSLRWAVASASVQTMYSSSSRALSGVLHTLQACTLLSAVSPRVCASAVFIEPHWVVM